MSSRRGERKIQCHILLWTQLLKWNCVTSAIQKANIHRPWRIRASIYPRVCRLAELFCPMYLLSSRTGEWPRAYPSHGYNRGIKGLSKDYALIQLSPKAGREMRVLLAYLVHVIRVERLPQKLPTDSLGSSSARNGVPCASSRESLEKGKIWVDRFLYKWVILL